MNKFKIGFEVLVIVLLYIGFFWCGLNLQKEDITCVEEKIEIFDKDTLVNKEIVKDNKNEVVRQYVKKDTSRVNDYAPEVPKLDSEVLRYIDRFKSTALSEQSKYSIPFSINMAQGIIESRSGKSKLAVKNNNHFGMKCFNRRCSKGHCSNHYDDHHKDFFRIYKTAWSSWRAHSQLLVGKRYKHLIGKNYKDWATGLKKAGYATDKKYDTKLIKVIEKYKLYKYDNF